MKSIITILLGLYICLPLMGVDKEKKLPFDFKSLNPLAEKGNAMAQFKLGGMFYLGDGVEKDLKEADRWWLKAAGSFRKAALKGDAEAQMNLGYMYDRGNGVSKNLKRANWWIRKAADQGYARAQTDLAYGYERGKGVLEDYVTAYAWYNIAAANGRALAKEKKTPSPKK